eukprot:jgi/Bigna1/81046/fgenesh1_pg.77_\
MNELELFGYKKTPIDVAVKIKDIETNLQTKTNHIVQNFTGSNGGVYLNTEIINNTRDIYTRSVIVNPTTGTKQSYLLNVDDGSKPNIRFRDVGKSRISTLETKTLPISLSMPSIPPVPLEHQFATSIYVNGVRSTTVPHNDGVYIGKDTNNASSVEMVSEICYIDFIHLPGDTHMNNVKGNSIQKNNTKTEYGDIGDTINHYGSLHYFYGPTTNHLQDTQVIIKNGSLKIENIVLERDDNNIFHINTNNQPAFVITGTHSIQNGSLAVEGIVKIKNDFNEPPISSALNIQARQNKWISFSVGTEEKANVMWDGTNLNFSVKDAKFKVNGIDVLDEISKLRNRVLELEKRTGSPQGEDGDLYSNLSGQVKINKNFGPGEPFIELPGVDNIVRSFF